MRLLFLAAVLAVALPAEAKTLQDRYDAGEAALKAGNYKTAVSSLSYVLSHLAPAQREGRTAAIIHSRLGDAEFKLGNKAAAVGHFQRALSGFNANPVADKYESAYAHLQLGLLSEMTVDYAAAARHFETARQLSSDPAILNAARIPLARVTLFSDPDTSRRLLDEAITAERRSGDRPNERLAELYSLRGRVELNAKNFQEALRWFDESVKLAGGLDWSASIADLRIRSDLSIAYYLSGSKRHGLELLKYTGAGRMPDVMPPLPGNDFLRLPDCAPITNIDRHDMVIVELSIRSDGRVQTAVPVYSSRPGLIEQAFARAALDWAWDPDDVKDLPPLWRAAFRVELRCTSSTGPSISPTDPYIDELAASLDRLGPLPPRGDSDFDRASALAEELSKREEKEGPDAVSLLPVLVALSDNPAVAWADAKKYIDRASEIGEMSALSPREHALLIVASAVRKRAFFMRKEVLPIAQGDFGDIGDVEQLATILVGRAYEAEDNEDKAVRAYQSVAEGSLPDGHRLKQVALLRLASLSFEADEAEKAQKYVSRTGLQPEQCSLVDSGPLERRSWFRGGLGYPTRLDRLGFEGSLVANYDISTDGRPIDPRIVVAYPPFIFDETVETDVARLRFNPIYRPGRDIGCFGREERYRYGQPRLRHKEKGRPEK